MPKAENIYASRHLYTTQSQGLVYVRDMSTDEPILTLTLAAAEDLSAELELQAKYGRLEVKVT